MFNTPQLFQTEPLGNPLGDVGIFIIDRLLTNVVQFLFDVMLLPTIYELLSLIVLLSPKIPEQIPEVVLYKPPSIIE
jgi:hypothetical protein